MDTTGLKARRAHAETLSNADTTTKPTNPGKLVHPFGKVRYPRLFGLLRQLLLSTYFAICVLCICATQPLGAPLYFVNRDYYYAYMALTKQSFGISIISVTQWFSPTLVRVSGDASVRGELRKGADGGLQATFPERMVLVANHQVYTDWAYLWYTAYASGMHGHLFIILKESLKYVPIIGTGMMFYGFIFMARKWVSDKPRLAYRLGKLKAKHSGPLSGSAGLDPMWLLIYPEGTNLSANTRLSSQKWAEKNQIPDLKNLLLPRTTGLFFCLQELQETVDWVYDCTVGYEGTPKSGYAAEVFSLRTIFVDGCPPKSVNMYWRRFAVSEIPLQDAHDFEAWIIARWREKDQLLDQFYKTGRFPALESSQSPKGEENPGYIESEVKLKKWQEVGQIFVVLAAFGLIANVITKLWSMFM